MHLYVWRHENEGLGLEWELDVSPWEGRRGVWTSVHCSALNPDGACLL